MRASEIFKVIDQFQSLLKQTEYFNAAAAEKLSHQVTNVRKQLSEITIGEEFAPIVEALCKKGTKIIEEIKMSKNDPKGNLTKAKMYVRYLRAAYGDFQGLSITAIKKFYRTFLVSAILFMILSPWYYGFILPGLMFVPIFLGSRGIKNRSYYGLLLGSLLIPVSFMTGIVWVTTMGNLEANATLFQSQTGYSASLAQIFAVGGPVLGAALLASCGLMVYYLQKARHYFI